MKSKISYIYLIITILLVVTSTGMPQSALNPDVKVISSDRNSITIEYTPQYLDTSETIVNNEKYIRVEVLGGSIPDPSDFGSPAVPQKAINLGVPAEFGNTIQVINANYKEISGRLIPIPELIKENNIDQNLYKTGPGYHEVKEPVEIVSFGDYGLLRGVPVQSILINPVDFNVSANKIRLYTRILFRINYSTSQSLTSGYSDKLVEGAILNYDIAKVWAKRENKGLKKSAAIINSVLASGKWFRFETPTEGFYKIDRSMLASYGIDAGSVNPKKIKIYNNGGKMLPENVNEPYPLDLQENAILVVGEEDGRFDEGDYILFYGRGNMFRDVDPSTNSIQRYNNYYSSVNYFWITVSGDNDGKRITNKQGLSQNADAVITTTPAFVDWDEDKINLLKSGRIFQGDDFSQSVRSRTYTNKLDGRVEGTPINYRVRFINGSFETVQLEVMENTHVIYPRTTLSGTSVYGDRNIYYVGRAYSASGSYSGALDAENRSLLKINFTPTAITSKGYLDFFEISYTKNLVPVDDYLTFYSNGSPGIIEYQLRNFSNSNIMVFDVTNHAEVKLITSPIMNSLGEYKFRVQENSGSLTKYLAVGNNNFKAPANPVEISNSNVHGISAGAKYVIITHKNFMEAAQRLKNFRENEAVIKYSAQIIDVDQIYNEFGGGVKDPSSIRNFLKYAYDNWSTEPEYVLMFGSGNYDYKNIEGYNTNFVAVWEDTEDMSELDSYTSDDFFARISGADLRVDLAMGRLPVKTAEEAGIVVDKIINYEKDGDLGTWRNLITLVSDDREEKESITEHLAPNETLSTSILSKSFDYNKIYLDEYPVVLTSQGERKPAVNAEIIKAINDGTIIFNYIGHGNPEVLAHEYVFEKSVTIPQLHNEKLFFLVAATCDFAYFDVPNLQSSTELMLFKANAGCIGAFASARKVFSDSNHQLMYLLFRNMFNTRDTLNLAHPMGYVNLQTKQTRTSQNDQKFFLFGDPLLRIKVPQYSAQIDSVNGQMLQAGSSVQVRALSNAKIHGHVVTPDGSIWSDFNGEGILTVYDSERNVPLEQINNQTIEVQGGIIFRGRISVTNGYFSESFIVPKDISYENKNGKVSVYFFNNDIDGIGYTTDVLVGGTDSSVVNDGQGPSVEIYFDDTSFKDSYLVNPNSRLIVRLNDETGLNTTGTGVGHTLEGILNDKESSPIDFTNYFTGDLNSGGRSGEINYQFSSLDQGEYKLQIKAWDVFNNYSTETTYFSVVNGEELVIRDIYNYPNPFVSNTTFTFQQNISAPIDVKVKVYTIAGRLIREIESNNISEKFVKIDWDGRDQDGSEIANGTYLYKIIVKSVDGEYSNSVLGKLAVLR